MRRFVFFLSLFFFVVEVLNPATVFVREYVGVGDSYVFHFEKKVPSKTPCKEQHEYVDSSAIVPQFSISLKPDQVQTAPVVARVEVPQVILPSIQRPPKQA